MVRCWVLVGDQHSTQHGMLLPTEAPPSHFGPLPNAADFQPGQWIVWAIPGTSVQVALVCVQIPLA